MIKDSYKRGYTIFFITCLVASFYIMVSVSRTDAYKAGYDEGKRDMRDSIVNTLNRALDKIDSEIDTRQKQDSLHK